MDYNGVITDYKFDPRSEPTLSTLSIRVDIPSMLQAVFIEEHDSIERLSQKFNFVIEPGPTWVFDLEGKKCIVRDSAEGFEFVRFRE